MTIEEILLQVLDGAALRWLRFDAPACPQQKASLEYAVSRGLVPSEAERCARLHASIGISALEYPSRVWSAGRQPLGQTWGRGFPWN